MIKDIAED